ncbi:MAG TPA: hypothetical protein VGZ93_05160 [Candidatus Methylacidiphilales bacterium]|nr:hypothetical protein [Candidatus Methylacidiphilales bacterium]
MIKTKRDHALAAAELEAEADYYYNQGLFDIGDEFLAEIEQALAVIAKSPHRWRLANARRDSSIRTYGPTKKFNYRVGYIEEESSIYILSYYYGGDKDPLSWMDRSRD